jgi:ribosomal protein L20A (L18A)
LYHDRSSVIKTYRNFKLVLQSPSFDETSVDIRYSNDAQEFKFKTIVTYADQPYAVTLKYSEFAPNEKVSYAEVRWQERSYWVKANLTSLQTKQLLVDMHFDKLEI